MHSGISGVVGYTTGGFDGEDAARVSRPKLMHEDLFCTLNIVVFFITIFITIFKQIIFILSVAK